MTQKEALDILKLGENVFLTGPAGSGKTFLLNEYISFLKANKVGVAITASTGIAATHIGGITIHSWCGMGIARKLNKAEFRNVLGKKYLQTRMNKARVLIIDEISMLDADRLDLVNDLCQSFKRSILPFGGLQVVFCGDFFQLPPINKATENNKYAFHSDTWGKCDLKICYLTEQHRHKDQDFISVLNSIRDDRVSQKTIDTLKDRIKLPIKSNIVPTKLYTNNQDVDAINNYELSLIKNDEKVFEMDYFCEKGKEKIIDSLIKNCMAPSKLILKVGAVVMFVKNKFDESGKSQYVNGTIGRVISFDDTDGLPIIETFDGRILIAHPREWAIEENDFVLAKITQVPLRLAWAITIHKSQGMSLDQAIIDLGSAFDFGMGYVALSRVRSLEGMCLLGLNQMALQISPEIKEIDQIFIKESNTNLLNLKNTSETDTTKNQKAFLKQVSRQNAREVLL